MSTYCIVELSDKEVEKQVDKVVTKRGQAIGKVIESESKDLIIKTFKRLLFLPKREDGKRSIGFVRLLF